MHWHILGAGAIGLLWAAKFYRAGIGCQLILRNQQKLADYTGQFQLNQADNRHVIKVGAEAITASSPIENLLITTKSYDALQAFAQVAPRLSSNARVLLLHNGMGPQQELSAARPDLQIWAGSTTDGAYLQSQFELVQAGQGQTLIGRLSDITDATLAEQLSGCEASLSHAANIHHSLWQKLAINCAINPLTAIYHCRNGELASNTEYRLHMQSICSEIETVAAQLQIPLFSTALIDQACRVAELTATNFSSMYQDVTNQRPNEIDTITGYLCQQADRLGIPVPENQRLLRQIRALSTSK